MNNEKEVLLGTLKNINNVIDKIFPDYKNQLRSGIALFEIADTFDLERASLVAIKIVFKRINREGVNCDSAISLIDEFIKDRWQ